MTIVFRRVTSALKSGRFELNKNFLKKVVRRARKLFQTEQPDAIRQTDVLPLAPKLQPVRLAPTEPMRLSLVVATYNVEPYIQQFLASIFAQSSKLDKFEVIIVDDGSTDRSGEIASDWAKRYPRHVRYIRQENQGVAAARNAGLKLARGTWISFPDPDDFLDVDYFKEMLKETEVEHKRPLLAVASNLIYFFEERQQFSDAHPLRFRFRQPVTRKLTSELAPYMMFSMSACWVRREALEKHALIFDSKVVPAFEDGHLLNRVLLLEPASTVTFLAEAKYYYRKRQDSSSLIDTSKNKPGWFLDQLEFGYLNLLTFAKALRGFVPKFVQRVVLYDLMWRFRQGIDRPDYTSSLTEHQKDKFQYLLQQIFQFLEEDTIGTFDLAGCTEAHKVALLFLYKGKRRERTAVYLRAVDSRAGLAQFSYFSGGSDVILLEIEVNGREKEAHHSSRRPAEFVGKTYFSENFFWIEIRDGDEVGFSLSGVSCTIKKGRKVIGHRASWLDLKNAAEPVKPEDIQLTARSRDLRRYSTSDAVRRKYRDAWLFQDRDDRADDNAEHLYRHLQSKGEAEDAYFVLSESSADWARLKRDGFKLLPFMSDEHIAALLNAEVLLSSHADEFVFWPVPNAEFADLARYKFVFLQHGVITTDLSTWLNGKDIRVFVTSTEEERRSIAASESPYTFSDREVALTGLPRHDSLLAAAREPDTILIAPTWRKYLTTRGDNPGVSRQASEGFEGTEYFRNWHAVIHHPALEQLARRHRQRIVFVPHPNATMYLDRFDVPPYVTAFDVRVDGSYQSLLGRVSTLISDFSSVASEAAYLQRSVIYFQFDEAEVFGGAHVCREGYFSFRRDGFGPVTTTVEDTIAALDLSLSGQEDPVYAERRRTTFPFRDGRCSERVVQAVKAALAGEPLPNNGMLGPVGNEDGEESLVHTTPSWPEARLRTVN